MAKRSNGEQRRLPAQTLRGFASSAKTRVENVRKEVGANRDVWPDLCAIPGINKRWLRAFVSAQIKRPPADRFMAVEWCLKEMD